MNSILNTVQYNHHGHRIVPPEAEKDKENASLSSNLLNEKRYSVVTRRYRKPNELLTRASLVQHSQEPINGSRTTTNMNVSNHLPSINQRDGAEVYKRPVIARMKKAMVFERPSVNGKPSEHLIVLNPKPRPANHDKENRVLPQIEKPERASHIEVFKVGLAEGRRTQLVEQVNKNVALGHEKEMAKAPMAIEPVRKTHMDAVQEAMSKVAEMEAKLANKDVEKGAESVDIHEQCNETVRKYSGSILEALKEKDKESTPIYCLKRHKIPANLRAKMIDWMVEVLSSYKCSDQTFFLAVTTMDLFLQRTKVVNDVSDLHLVGVTCMFMASKYEEIYPLRLNVIHEKIAHRKLSTEDIKSKEMEIFATLDYKLTNVTPYEFIMSTVFQMDLKNSMVPKHYEYLLKVCVYLAKANMHDYELMSQQDYSELAAATLFVAFKIIEQLDKSFPLGTMLNQLKEILKVDEEVVYDCAARILTVAKTFDKLYPNLENLKKFHSFNFDDVVARPQNQAGRPRTNSTH